MHIKNVVLKGELTFERVTRKWINYRMCHVYSRALFIIIIIFFPDCTIHRAVDTFFVYCLGQRSRTRGVIVQQSTQEPDELFHHALGSSWRVQTIINTYKS